jgi:nucleotidyltransferase/DNA polymerase involved in DNA repair
LDELIEVYREAIYNEIASKLQKQRSRSKNLALKNLSKQVNKVKTSEQPSIGNKSTKTSEVRKRNLVIRRILREKKKRYKRKR